jgi:hypothetical protein
MQRFAGEYNWRNYLASNLYTTIGLNTFIYHCTYIIIVYYIRVSKALPRHVAVAVIELPASIFPSFVRVCLAGLVYYNHDITAIHRLPG